MLAPGKNYPGSPVRLGVDFQDQSGTDEDPTGITLSVISPKTGTLWGSYVYGVDSTITKTSAGNYFADVSPDWPGKWAYRWETQDGSGNTTLALEGTFLVQTSAFTNTDSPYDYAGYAWWSW